MAFGTPVIAYNKGGVTESVLDGECGVLLESQTAYCLKAAVERFEKLQFAPKCRDQFDAACSLQQFSATIGIWQKGGRTGSKLRVAQQLLVEQISKESAKAISPSEHNNNLGLLTYK